MFKLMIGKAIAIAIAGGIGAAATLRAFSVFGS